MEYEREQETCTEILSTASIVRLVERVTGMRAKYNTMKMAFKQMENINIFLSTCEKYGVAKTDLFQTVDLYENQNLWQVVCTIHALGRKVGTMGGFHGSISIGLCTY